MGRRNLHTREEQRDMALTAAEELLVSEGLGGLSMRKVAQAMGYTVGNLYLLFTNQDDLLATLNERTADALHETLQQAAQRHSDPLRQVKAMSSAYITFAQAHPHRWRLMFEHQLPPDMRPRPAIDRRLERLFGLVQEVLRPLLPQARAERLRFAAAAVWSAVHGVCSLTVTTKLQWSGLSDHVRLTEALVETTLAGLGSGGVALVRRPRR